jgi:hypothetical protein
MLMYKKPISNQLFIMNFNLDEQNNEQTLYSLSLAT